MAFRVASVQSSPAEMSRSGIQHRTRGLKLSAECARDPLILMCVTDEDVVGHTSLIHLTKIVSNTQPSAAHAAPRMSQMTRMA